MDLRVLAIFVIVAFLHPMTTKVTILCYYFLSIESLGASLNRSIADLTYLLFYLFLARAHGTYCKSDTVASLCGSMLYVTTSL